MKKYFFALLIITAFLNKTYAAKIFDKADTIFAVKALPNAKYLKPDTSRYMMLINDHKSYTSVKFLERISNTDGGRLMIIQHLYYGAYTNTDSVIVNSQTLAPIESYSEINTSTDRFIYQNGHVTGSVQMKDTQNAGKIVKTDTVFNKQPFNGLIYFETYRSLNYKIHQPFYISEYVPGRQMKITKVEYINDDILNFSGRDIKTQIIETTFGKTKIHIALDKLTHEVLKIEGHFPKFDYSLVKAL